MKLRTTLKQWNRWFRRPRVLDSLSAYHLWAAEYPPEAHNALMRTEQAAMVELMPPLRDLIVLDLACGTGRYGLMAQQSGARLVIGVDNSVDMLARNGLRFRAAAGMTRLPLAAESVDVVLCGLAIGHVATLEPILTEIVRVLKPNGTALISDVHPDLFLQGGQRTFTAQGKTYAVEHYPHTISQVRAFARTAGLLTTTIAEPHLPEGAGAGGSYGVPVAVIYRFQKPHD
ncbi:MAG: class I SAM-dependent methyltransferase [Anaerolineae bacterium]